MRWGVLLASVALVFLLSLASMTALGAGAQATRFHVAGTAGGHGADGHHSKCSILVSGENPGDNAIQSAINSASLGSTICIGPGTYPEQLTIHTPITLIGCSGEDHHDHGCSQGDHGSDASQVIIAPSTVALDTVDYDTEVPAAPIIWVNTTASDSSMPTVISGVTVDGSSAAASWTYGCSDFLGVYYQSSSGVIQGVNVEGVHFPGSLLG